MGTLNVSPISYYLTTDISSNTFWNKFTPNIVITNSLPVNYQWNISYSIYVQNIPPNYNNESMGFFLRLVDVDLSNSPIYPVMLNYNNSVSGVSVPSTIIANQSATFSGNDFINVPLLGTYTLELNVTPPTNDKYNYTTYIQINLIPSLIS
jgi:hypothetical protein